MSTKPEINPSVDNRISVRLPMPLAERFAKIVEVSKRTKTNLIEECLETSLPQLEKQYGRKQLKAA